MENRLLIKNPICIENLILVWWQIFVHNNLIRYSHTQIVFMYLCHENFNDFSYFVSDFIVFQWRRYCFKLFCFNQIWIDSWTDSVLHKLSILSKLVDKRFCFYASFCSLFLKLISDFYQLDRRLYEIFREELSLFLLQLTPHSWEVLLKSLVRTSDDHQFHDLASYVYLSDCQIDYRVFIQELLWRIIKIWLLWLYSH